jgi:hypothetical protein
MMRINRKWTVVERGGPVVVWSKEVLIEVDVEQ